MISRKRNSRHSSKPAPAQVANHFSTAVFLTRTATLKSGEILEARLPAGLCCLSLLQQRSRPESRLILSALKTLHVLVGGGCPLDLYFPIQKLEKINRRISSVVVVPVSASSEPSASYRSSRIISCGMPLADALPAL